MEYAVFGVGNEVRLRYCNEFIEKIDFFVDNDIRKQGKKYMGKEIFSPEILKTENAFVIISPFIEYYNIKQQLENYGLKEKDNFVWGPNWYGNDDIPSAYGYKSWKDYDCIVDFSVGKWDYRVKTVADCFDENIKSVLDLGAGAMSLKKYLASDIEYYPVDYCQRMEKTIVCDFESGEFPEKHVDCIVASGILEYISNLPWFVDQICSHCSVTIISYISIERMNDFLVRHHEGWKNHYSLVQLIRLFHMHNFYPVEERFCDGNDLIIKFIKTI